MKYLVLSTTEWFVAYKTYKAMVRLLRLTPNHDLVMGCYWTIVYTSIGLILGQHIVKGHFTSGWAVDIFMRICGSQRKTTLLKYCCINSQTSAENASNMSTMLLAIYLFGPLVSYVGEWYNIITYSTIKPKWLFMLRNGTKFYQSVCKNVYSVKTYSIYI